MDNTLLQIIFLFLNLSTLIIVLLFRGNVFFILPVFTWLLVYATLPSFTMLVTSDTFTYFLNDPVFLFSYICAYYSFIIVLALYYARKDPSYKGYTAFRGNSSRDTFIISIILFLIVALWYIKAANFNLGGMSKSDYLMSKQDEIVSTGQGSGMFLRQLEFLLYLFIGWGLTIGKRKVRFLFILYSFIIIQIIITFFGGLYRSPILAYSLFAILVHYRLYNRSRKFYVYLFILVVSLPFLMSALAYVRDGRLPEWQGIIFALTHGLSGFATVLEIRHLYDNYTLEYGYQFLLNMITFIPRFLWEAKPITSFSFRVSEEIFGEIGLNAAWIHTFTIFGEGYRQFGGVGMIIAAIITGLLLVLTIAMVIKNPFYRVLGAFMLVQYPLVFRGDLNAMFGRTYEFLIAILIFQFIVFISPKRKIDAD